MRTPEKPGPQASLHLWTKLLDRPPFRAGRLHTKIDNHLSRVARMGSLRRRQILGGLTVAADTETDEEVEVRQEVNSVEFTELPSEDAVTLDNPTKLGDAVLHATDWTTETIISQLKRGTILLNPSFQRRDAWTRIQKSKFIESLILGLPIPQIVLAESRQGRGKFIVLDGKQRLLALLQFWGLGTGAKNGYALSGLEALKELSRLRFHDLETAPEHEEALTALLNQPIRTIVIKNWPNIDFLHLVFLRLNTGSVKLSPQELRQALFPGEFSTWVDTAAADSPGIRKLLNLEEPDYRMRDIEILARFLAFRFFADGYNGRMKNFIDATFEKLNAEWARRKADIDDAMEDLEAAIKVLLEVFEGNVARKPGSKPFNRAVFDFLAFYAQRENVRTFMRANPARVREAYEELFKQTDFKAAVERDTAGVPNTVLRLARWGQALARDSELKLPIPTSLEGNRLTFSGF
jgi:Protein of unknown function DUF262